MKIGMSGGAPQCEELIVGRPSLVPVSLQHVSTHKAQKVPARRRWAHLRQLPASPEFSGILRKRLRPYVARAPARMATRFAIIQSTRRVSMIQCPLSVNPGKIIDFYNRVFWETALQPIGTPQRLVLIARHGQRGCCQELYLLCVSKTSMRWLRRFLPLHGCRKAPCAKRQWIGIRRRGLCAQCVPLTLSLVAKVHGLCSSAKNTLRCPPGSKEVRCRSPSRGHAAIRSTIFIVGRRSRYAALRVRPRAARSRRGHNILKKPSRWRTYPADFLKSAVNFTSSFQVERRFSLRVATGH